VKPALSDFALACIAFAVIVIIGTFVLLPCGGWLADIARTAWANGTGLEALIVLAIGATVAAIGAMTNG